MACVQVDTFNRSAEKLETSNNQLFGAGGKGTVVLVERVLLLLSACSVLLQLSPEMIMFILGMEQ